MTSELEEVPLRPLLRTREAAAYLSLSEATMCRWRQRKIGPAFVYVDGIARYRPEALVAWVEQMEQAGGRADRAS